MLVYLYNKIPRSFRNKIGQTKSLKWFRDLILRKDGHYKERVVEINRTYLTYDVSFKFVASIKEASNALTKGIENTMLRNSMVLLDRSGKKTDDVIIFDIGANFGYLSLVWAKSICKTGQIISFEPSLNVYNSLNNSVTLNNLSRTVKLENLAVGNDNKPIKLYLEDSTSNVIPSEDSQLSQTVNMVRIDDYVTKHKIVRCDLIKIDVDGLEMDILKGCINTLDNFKPICIVETNDDVKIVEFFIQKGYLVLDEKLEIYKHNEKLPPNIYCVPNEL